MTWAFAFETSFEIGGYDLAETLASVIETAAVLAISLAVLAAIVGAIREGVRSNWPESFRTFKMYMGRGLLVGLDLLIAADIIKTVTVEPTIENATVLGLLVLIRTFLSWSIVLEITGHWPWQTPRDNAAEPV